MQRAVADNAILGVIAEYLDVGEIRAVRVALKYVHGEHVLHVVRKKLSQVSGALSKVLETYCQSCAKHAAKGVWLGPIYLCRRCNQNHVPRSKISVDVFPLVQFHFGGQLAKRDELEHAELIIERRVTEELKLHCSQSEVLLQLMHDLGPEMFALWSYVFVDDASTNSIRVVGFFKGLVAQRVRRVLSLWYTAISFEQAVKHRQRLLQIITDVSQMEALLHNNFWHIRASIHKASFEFGVDPVSVCAEVLLGRPLDDEARNEVAKKLLEEKMSALKMTTSSRVVSSRPKVRPRDAGKQVAPQYPAVTSDIRLVEQQKHIAILTTA